MSDKDSASYYGNAGVIANMVLLWPYEDITDELWIPLAASIGVGYWFLGGRIAGVPTMELVKAYLLAGGVSAAYVVAMESDKQLKKTGKAPKGKGKGAY